MKVADILSLPRLRRDDILDYVLDHNSTKMFPHLDDRWDHDFYNVIKDNRLLAEDMYFDIIGEVIVDPRRTGVVGIIYYTDVAIAIVQRAGRSISDFQRVHIIDADMYVSWICELNRIIMEYVKFDDVEAVTEVDDLLSFYDDYTFTAGERVYNQSL